MKILHTADWHLGRSLYGRKRYDEFAGFLDWLSATIETEGIDALLVAGDIFDTSTPSNRAQELYYRFLCKVSGSCCRHIVIIAGNHDSPSFLNAPKELLRALNVYIVGAMTENPEEEVIVLKNNPQITPMNTDEQIAIVCAVPYLRDKDIRVVEAGETMDDKNRKLVEGIKAHYERIVIIAEQKRDELLQKSKINSRAKRDRLASQGEQHSGNQKSKIPIVAMGHLFTAGGKTVEGDGVRDLYVGSLAHVGEDVFPASIDYLALGHLHVPQCVGNTEHIRYSGSPIPMGYGEATQEKSVVIVEIKDHNSKITLKKVPCFQPLERIAGSVDDIHTRIAELKSDDSNAWLEIEYTGSGIIGNLRELLDEALIDSSMEIRRIKNKRIMDRVISAIHEDETLDDLDVNDVFERCLDTFDVPPEDRSEMTDSYNEIIHSLLEEDKNAE